MSIPELVILSGLAGLSVIDLRIKRIPVYGVVLLGIIALAFRLLAGVGIWTLAVGVLPGAFLVLLAYATRESIGIGDGLVTCAMGIFCGIRQTVAVLGMALLLSAVLAMVLLVLKRAGRKTELPFLPCLCSGYLLCLLW